MPTNYTNTLVKRNGPEYIKANIANVFLCIAPLKTDTVSQIAAKAIATAPFTGADVTIAESGNDVTCTFNPKSAIDPTGTADDLNDDIAVVYCSDTVNMIAIDATDRDITNETNDTVSIPTGQYTVPELVSA